MKARTRPGRRTEPSEVVNGLGSRLRNYRETAAMSVRELARRIEVSPSLISQAEHGKVTPSVETLYRVANELGLSVGDFFNDNGRGHMGRNGEPTPSPGGAVQRRETRRKVQLAGGVTWELLTPQPNDKVEFLHVVYPVGGESCPTDSLVRHGGKEYACVLSGRLGIRLGFEEFELGPGDSIAFDAQQPHRLWTIGSKPATAIWVILNREGDGRAKPV
jgi:DNA-binding XRE family transcriptional regulator/quercetin dioxygenase-like cupin family protein